jgi:hypothetical protein
MLLLFSFNEITLMNKGARSMNKEQLVTPEMVREFLNYDSETGLFTWRERDISWFEDRGGRYTAVWCQKNFNNKHGGRPAFTAVAGNGYLSGGILGKTFKAHRVAWAHYYGSWPEFTIDHINRDRSDNRIENLRDVLTVVNNHNVDRRRGEYVGVTWWEPSRKWLARVTKGGKQYYLGYFDDPIEAARVRDLKARELYGADAFQNLS